MAQLHEDAEALLPGAGTTIEITDRSEPHCCGLPLLLQLRGNFFFPTLPPTIFAGVCFARNFSYSCRVLPLTIGYPRALALEVLRTDSNLTIGPLA